MSGGEDGRFLFLSLRLLDCVTPLIGGLCSPSLSGVVGYSYWNPKYGLGNEKESASVYFLNVKVPSS